MDGNDELGNDEGWDSDEVGFHREEYRPRKSRRRECGGDGVLDDASHDGKDELMGAAPPAENSRTGPQTTDEPPKPVNPPKSSAATAGEDTPQPKKRGRKKKQPPVQEAPAQDELAKRLASESVAATKPVVPEPEPPTEKPKKKRGRPRKSDTAKPDTAALEERAIEEPATEEMPPTQPFEPAAAGLGPVTEEQPPRESETTTTFGKSPSAAAAAAHKSTATPLHETDGANKGAAIEPRSAASSSTAPGKTLAAAGKPQQPVYRVGLSKKSRVASLLKIKPRQ